MAPKQRFVNFYGLVNSEHGSTDEEPASNIWDSLDAILELSVGDRMEDIKDDKFMYLESVVQHRGGIIAGYFISAKNKYRADLVDRKTGKKRKNPKSLTEGEQEKTHFVIQVSNEGVKAVVERNFYGVSMEYIIWYINKMNKFIDPEISYRLYKSEVMQDNIMEQLRRLSSVQVAEVYVDKQMLGEGGLDFSKRLASMKHSVILTVKASPGESIKNAAIDMFNKINSGRVTKRIERVRVFGKDDEQNQAKLDSLDLIKKDSAPFNLNPDGEIETAHAFTILKGFFNKFDVH